MTHDESTNKKLSAAKPFDRAFVDEMHPHHGGAVKMVEVVLQETKDPELRRLAEGIASTQEREIREMDAFRKKRYGAPVPASDHGGGKHGGGHAG